MRGLGLVATQTLIFVFADIAGPVAIVQRVRDAYTGMAAHDHQLIRAGLAANGR